MASERLEHVFVLFDAALALPDEDRGAFLVRECGDDDGLREDVQSLLVAHAEAEGFLSNRSLQSGISRRAAPRLAPGLRLGAFEVERFLGAGGMGEVYQARDTRLDRRVAIKVLPPDTATDPRSRAQFAYEARVIARLSHPRICALHDIGHHDGIDFLVMEHLEGETLAERVRKGPLPLSLAVRTALEIAEALVAAHAQGIVHRDLKPGNVMMTPGGAKLLDFGLARLRRMPGLELSTTAPANTGGTSPGLIAGTLPYMAPEQLEGRDVDARVDVFAFGAVLYEMVTGRKAFDGASEASVISAILSSEPPRLPTIQPSTPPAVDRLVQTCLAKDRTARWSSVHDIALQLEWLLREGPETRAPEPRVRWNRRHKVVGGTAAAAAVILAAIWGATFRRPAPNALAHVLFAMPPPGSTFATEEAPAISPDGRQLTFVAHDSGGKRLLYMHALEGFRAAQPLTDTDGASLPFWSPDGRSVGFFAQGKLKKIELATGRVQILTDAEGPRGGTWNRDDVILFVPRPRDGPYRIAASGGTSQPVATVTGQPSGGWYPSFLPDGRHFVFFLPSPAQPENASVWLGSLDSSIPPKRLVSARSGAAYAPPGYLLFWRDGTLLAQEFDERALEIRGNAATVVSAGLNPISSQALFSVSDSGTLVFFAGAVTQSEIGWVDRDGRRLGKVGPKGVFNSVSLSPDENSAVYDRADPRTGSTDLWRLDFARAEPSRLTFHPAHDIFPLWSTDGARIVFTSLRAPPPQLYELEVGSAGNEKLLVPTRVPTSPTGWSSDGRLLLYTSTHPQTGGDIWALSLVDDREPLPLVRTAADERYGTLSPDGHWLAYISNETGAYEVYIDAFPSTGARRQASTAGGFEPLWRHDGRELFYMAPNQTLMSVEVRSTPKTLDLNVPRPLFPARFQWMEIQAVARHFAASRDGQRFLISSATDEAQSASVTVVLNWTAALAK